MKPYTTSQRLREFSNKYRITQAEILRRAQPYCQRYGVKLTKSALSQYFSGKHEPENDKLTILGLALNVSEVWLMGYDVPMERKTTSAPAAQGDGRLTKINELAARLSPEEQDNIIFLIERLLSRR